LAAPNPAYPRACMDMARLPFSGVEPPILTEFYPDFQG
jgi:hypothetical protein